MNNRNCKTGVAIAAAARVFAMLAVAAFVLAPVSASGAGEGSRYAVRRLNFPGGKKAITVTPETWTVDASGAVLTAPGGIRITLESGKAASSGACDWAELQAVFADFPSDRNTETDLRTMEQTWYAPRGAEGACVSVAISGRAAAVVMRLTFKSGGVMYSLRSDRLSWGKTVDGPAFVSLERDMNILGSYFFFAGTDGYAKLEDAIGRGGVLVEAAPVAAVATGTVSTVYAGPATSTAVVEPAATPTAPAIARETPEPSTSELITPEALLQDADLQRARRLKNNGKYAEAEEAFRALIPRIPFEARTGLGDVLVAQERYSEAITQFQTASVLRPNSPDPYNGLGSAYFYQSEWDTARGFFNRALELDPANAVAMSNLGWIALGSGPDVKAAADFFKRALASNPADVALAGIYTGLATVSVMQGEDTAALGYCDKLIALMPDAAVAYTLRASILLSRDDAAGALEAANNARRLDGAQHQAHAFAAQAAARLGKFVEAAGYFREAIRTAPPGAPEAAEYHLGLARVLYAAQDKIAVKNALKDALEAYPDSEKLKAALDRLDKGEAP